MIDSGVNNAQQEKERQEEENFTSFSFLTKNQKLIEMMDDSLSISLDDFHAYLMSINYKVEKNELLEKLKKSKEITFDSSSNRVIADVTLSYSVVVKGEGVGKNLNPAEILNSLSYSDKIKTHILENEKLTITFESKRNGVGADDRQIILKGVASYLSSKKLDYEVFLEGSTKKKNFSERHRSSSIKAFFDGKKEIKPFFPKSMLSKEQNATTPTDTFKTEASEVKQTTKKDFSQRYSSNLEYNQHYLTTIGATKNSVELRRLSKNPRRVSRSKFNEIFGYDVKTGKKGQAIERNKFNLKMENVQTDILGFNKFYKDDNMRSISPTVRQKSTSRAKGRLSLNSYYKNPLDAEEYIPANKRNSIEVLNNNATQSNTATQDNMQVQKMDDNFKYDTKEILSVFYHMKFLKQFDLPKGFQGHFNDVYMLRQARDNLDSLKIRNNNSNEANLNRHRAHTFMDNPDNKDAHNKRNSLYSKAPEKAYKKKSFDVQRGRFDSFKQNNIGNKYYY